MIIENTFSVSRPIEQAWDLLTDIEGVAPCMPGARLTDVEGDTYYGEVRVKIGPVQTRFRGEVSFDEQDAANRYAVIVARGKDTGGKGLASARITAHLTQEEASDVTTVSVSTDLTISGKIAQFGRGAVADVSTKLLTRFADCLESRLGGAGGNETVPAPSAESAVEPAEASAPTPEAVPPAPAFPESGAEEEAREPTPAQSRSEAATPNSAEDVADEGTREIPSSGEEAGADEAQHGEAQREGKSAHEFAKREPGDDDSAESTSAGTRDAPRRRRIDSPEPEPIDLLNTGGQPASRSLIPIGIIVVLIVIVIVLVII